VNWSDIKSDDVLLTRLVARLVVKVEPLVGLVGLIEVTLLDLETGRTRTLDMQACMSITKVYTVLRGHETLHEPRL